jgi:MinD-like ATPase involved in chromosome partitioning or flagellar assembly
MRAVAVVSVGGSPGVTSLVCAAAFADRPVLVIEAAPSGGTIAARWRLEVLSAVNTTAKLAMDVSGTVDLWAATHHPWLGQARVLPAHPSAAVMRQAQVGRWLADRIRTVAHPVLVDAGRVDGSADQLELLSAADEVWVLVDPIVEQVTAASAMTGWLNKTGPVGLLVREPAGDPARASAGAVTATLGWPVVATVPEDHPAARALCGLSPPRRNLLRSPLLRTARALAERLTGAETEVVAG